MNPHPPVPEWRGLICDMDGLLFDSERVMREAWRRAATEAGFPFGHEVYARLVGRTDEAGRAVLREEFGPAFPLARCEGLAGRYYDEHLRDHGIPLKPGARELVAWLEERGIPAAVATSTFRRRALVKLARGDLLHRFRSVVTGDQVAHGKPAPDIYLAAARALGLAAVDCLALEDSPTGAQAALAAGCRVIVVPDLVAPPAPLRDEVLWVAPDLHAVRSWLSAGPSQA